jgi:hypothetical protein
VEFIIRSTLLGLVVLDIYNLVITLELLALISIVLAQLTMHPQCHPPLRPSGNHILNCVPIPRFQIEIIRLYKKLNIKPNTKNQLTAKEPLNLLGVAGFLSIGWSGHLVHLARLFASSLTFFGGLKPDTMSLYLTDIGHHHLAVGILFLVLAHLYSSLNGSSLDPHGSSKSVSTINRTPTAK